MFITVEGIEGVGKTTITRHLNDYLKAHDYQVVLTREPGGTLLAEKLREFLLHNQNESSKESITAETELLLMFAARSQHIHHFIKPQLALGKVVISDRFTDSSFAYQGGGRRMATVMIESLQYWVQADLVIDLTLLLDAPFEVVSQRLRGASLDRIEKESQSFFGRVRQSYLRRASLDPQRFEIIDATKPLDEMKTKINEIIVARLIKLAKSTKT